MSTDIHPGEVWVDTWTGKTVTVVEADGPAYVHAEENGGFHRRFSMLRHGFLNRFCERGAQ